MPSSLLALERDPREKSALRGENPKQKNSFLGWQKLKWFLQNNLPDRFKVSKNFPHEASIWNGRKGLTTSVFDPSVQHV